MKKNNGPSFGFFSFFTGAGFLDLGFEKAGFVSLFSNELVSDFCEVYNYSRKKLNIENPKYGLHQKTIECFLNSKEDRKFLKEKISEAKKELDFVGFIGGPPCPDFSVAGKNKGADGSNGRLSKSYIELICSQNPDFFIFENVKGLWKTSEHRMFFNKLIEQVHKARYSTAYRVINAMEYGVPQDRERIILIGIKHGASIKDKFEPEIKSFPWDRYIKYSMESIKNMSWPITTTFKENSQIEPPKNIIKELTVQNWFEKNNVTNHSNSNDFFQPRAGFQKMKIYAEGDDSKKCYKRLHRWRYSPTAAYGNNEVHLHPYKARRLSTAETLAIQSLPKEFELPTNISLTAKFKTIGNGVPYLAAYGIAQTLSLYLKTMRGF